MSDATPSANPLARLPSAIRGKFERVPKVSAPSLLRLIFWTLIWIFSVCQLASAVNLFDRSLNFLISSTPLPNPSTGIEDRRRQALPLLIMVGVLLTTVIPLMLGFPMFSWGARKLKFLTWISFDYILASILSIFLLGQSLESLSLGHWICSTVIAKTHEVTPSTHFHSTFFFFFSFLGGNAGIFFSSSTAGAAALSPTATSPSLPTPLQYSLSTTLGLSFTLFILLSLYAFLLLVISIYHLGKGTITTTTLLHTSLNTLLYPETDSQNLIKKKKPRKPRSADLEKQAQASYLQPIAMPPQAALISQTGGARWSTSASTPLTPASGWDDEDDNESMIDSTRPRRRT